VDVFPAAESDTLSGEAPAAPSAADDAVCYYHPEHRAVTVCEHSGRYLCAQCDVEWFGRHMSPEFVASQVYGGDAPFRMRYTRYDLIVRYLAVTGIVFFLYPSLITAPIALYLAWRHWGDARNPAQDFRRSMALGAGISGLSLTLWVLAMAGFVGMLITAGSGA